MGERDHHHNSGAKSSPTIEQDPKRSDEARSSQPRNSLRHLFAELRDETVELFRQIRRHLRVLVIFSIVLFLGGLLYAWSGLYSLAASSGHYPFFRVFLAWAMRNSVETQTANYKVPSLDDLAMIQRGAGSYEGVCSTCHGSPILQRNPVAKRMLPEPPYLGGVIASWTPEQLFWIVKHGLKYTGMPAWPALSRDDEVWSVVAFLLRLPGMEAETYRSLAYGPLADGTAGADEGIPALLRDGPAGDDIAACARCHGFKGAGRSTGAFPRLPGQTEEYLYGALKSYALGTRPSGIMQPVAASLTDAEMRALAEYYAGVTDAPPAPAPEELDPRVLQLGQRIAFDGLPEQNVAACASCHGPGPGSRPPLYPSLAGQHAKYLAGQLSLFAKGSRANTPLAEMMTRAIGTLVDGKVTMTLSDDQIRAVSLYYASLPAPAALATSVPKSGGE